MSRSQIAGASSWGALELGLLGLSMGIGVGVANFVLQRVMERRRPSLMKSLSHLHHLDPNLAKGKAAENQDTSSEASDMVEVFQVVLTGGPCAGKSSCVAYFSSKLRRLGYDVYEAPEIPTLLMNSGCVYPGANACKKKLLAFETALLELQLQTEQTFFSIASCCPPFFDQSFGNFKGSVILYDRGMLDVAAFVPKEIWGEVVNYSDFIRDEVSNVHDKYDLVIHMTTSAKGAESFYRMKQQTLEEAIALDDRLLACYHDLPQHHVVDNSTDFEQKLQRAFHLVLKLLEEGSM